MYLILYTTLSLSTYPAYSDSTTISPVGLVLPYELMYVGNATDQCSTVTVSYSLVTYLQKSCNSKYKIIKACMCMVQVLKCKGVVSPLIEAH